MKRLLSIVALAGVVLASSHALADGDADKGKRLFNRCKACHTIEKGGHNKMGPNLYGVVGRKAGSVEDYNYSDALKNAGFDWNEEKLDGWLENPRKYLPGNKMTFVGLRKEDQREDVIAYLKQLGAE